MMRLVRAAWVVSVALLVQPFGIARDLLQQPEPQPSSTPTRATPVAEETQQQAPAPPLSDPELQRLEKELPEQHQEKELRKEEQSNRILGILPQFGVTRQNAAPITPSQKFRLFRRSAFDPVEFALVGVQAGISQASNTFSGYGQGAEGYAKRYGAAFADHVSGSFFSGFAYPVLLKQDPRYFRLGEGSIKHRIGYALAQEFVCKTDKGKRDFNYSEILGAFTSGGISNIYYPPANRGFGLTMSRVGLSILYGSLGGLVDEFWIDIDQKLFHKKKQKGVAPSPSKDRPPN